MGQGFLRKLEKTRCRVQSERSTGRGAYGTTFFPDPKQKPIVIMMIQVRLGRQERSSTYGSLTGLSGADIELRAVDAHAGTNQVTARCFGL
jgi:hypothetical protein